MKLKSVKIGDTVVPHGLFLGPMAGFTDLPFRKICRECGADYTVTEMISAKAVCFGDKKTAELAKIDHPTTALQIFGHDPDDIETACRMIFEKELYRMDGATSVGGSLHPQNEEMPRVEKRYSSGGRSLTDTVGQVAKQTAVVSSLHPQDEEVPKNEKTGIDRSLVNAVTFDSECYTKYHSTEDCPSGRPDKDFWEREPFFQKGFAKIKPCGLDINMGCPVKKIVTSGDGSALMLDPDLCRRIVEAAVRGSDGVPVTVKIRAGFDADRKNAVQVATEAVRGGASAVFVHGRTREQFYAPSSDNKIIAAVRDALPPEIPVIGNGDVVTVEDAERMLRETGCDGIMIGRAALGDPWLFERIIAAGEGVNLPEPTVDERIAMAIRLCRDVCELYGESRGIPMCRGRAGHFIKGITGAAAIRDRMCHATTLAEVCSIFGIASAEE